MLFDPIRKKKIIATPEEIVRQLWLIHFTQTMSINPKRIAVERGFSLNGLSKRFDVMIFGMDTTPKLILECKAPGIPITQMVFDQIAEYNMKWEVPYSLVSNGREHYCFSVDHLLRSYTWHEDIPRIV